MSWRSNAEDAYEEGGIDAVASQFGEGRKTRVTVNITRHERCVFEFEGVLSEAEAVERIEAGDDPIDSNIRCEDIDVVAHEVTP